APGTADRALMVHSIESIADKLGRQPELFDRIFYKADLRSLHNRALMLLPKGEIAKIQDSLQSMRMLLDLGTVGWRSLTLWSLYREANTRLVGATPGQALKEADLQFLGQLHAITHSAALTLEDPAKYHNPWTRLMNQRPEQKDLLQEPQYFFSGDGSLAFLLV